MFTVEFDTNKTISFWTLIMLDMAIKQLRDLIQNNERIQGKEGISKTPQTIMKSKTE